MSEPNEPLKIMGWHIDISWTDGTTEVITDLPDDIAQSIDDYFSDLETEKAHELAMKHGEW
jgi:hypothetical protein